MSYVPEGRGSVCTEPDAGDEADTHHIPAHLRGGREVLASVGTGAGWATLSALRGRGGEQPQVSEVHATSSARE